MKFYLQLNLTSDRGYGTSVGTHYRVCEIVRVLTRGTVEGLGKVGRE